MENDRACSPTHCPTEHPCQAEFPLAGPWRCATATSSFVYSLLFYSTNSSLPLVHGNCWFSPFVPQAGLRYISVFCIFCSKSFVYLLSSPCAPMKRPCPDSDSASDVSLSARSNRKKRQVESKSICPGDQFGPRIYTVLKEFAKVVPVPSYMRWLYQLESSCIHQGCYIANCDVSAPFSHTHGPKVLVNAITVFLSYHVPKHTILMMTSDDDWREILASIRVFLIHCIQRGYIKENIKLLTALYKLRVFKICGIPRRLTFLFKHKYWDSLENNDRQSESDGSSSSKTKSVDHVSFERYFGDEIAVTVEKVMSNGWVLRSDYAPFETRDVRVFLQLPSEVARLGMADMTLSCILLGLRNGIWRPVEQSGVFVINAYPPDHFFYF